MATDADRYPVNFEQWPRGDQLLHITDRYRRGRLIEILLLAAGRDLDDYALDDDRKLSKRDVASLYIVLGGTDRERYPEVFHQLDAAGQADFVADRYYREGLLEEVLALAGRDTGNRALHSDSKLRKKDLAAIYLTLEGISHDE